MEQLERINETEVIRAENTALVVIDLQNGILGRPHAPHTSEKIIENTRKLTKAFEDKGGFVVFVKVESLDGKDMLSPITDSNAKMDFSKIPKEWTDYVPELSDIKGAYTITKRQWGAFYGTDLDLQLRRRGIDTIVLCGVSTNIGVDTTAREAYQSGYNQIFVEEAMTAVTKEEHDYVCKYIFPRMGRVKTSDEVISQLR